VDETLGKRLFRVAAFLAMSNIPHPWKLPMLKHEINIIIKLNNKKITRPKRSRFLVLTPPASKIKRVPTPTL
jgi:hypothetical protein